MARMLPFLAAAFLALALLPSAVAVTLVQPRWSVGDEWTYEIELVENGATVQTGERHVVVTQRGTFASRDALWFTSYQNMTGDPSSSFADIRDAATGALLGTQSGGETFTAVAPCHETQYPLEYPKSWTVSCDLGFGPVEALYTVAGEERLSLPAGTYDTLSVDAIGNDAVRIWFADAACGKVAEFSQTNDLATYVNLTSVRCTPATVGPTPTTPVTTSATPSATPTRATTTTPTRATPTTSEHDYSCPPGTSHDNGSCLTSDADRDGSLLRFEMERGTDPTDADTDDDGIRDGDDANPLTRGGAEDNRSGGNATRSTDTPGLGAPALLVALVAAAAIISRRKPS